MSFGSVLWETARVATRFDAIKEVSIGNIFLGTFSALQSKAGPVFGSDGCVVFLSAYQMQLSLRECINGRVRKNYHLANVLIAILPNWIDNFNTPESEHKNLIF